MDSDDNMLVIDEWHEGMSDNEEMEVSSTTPSKSVSPVRRNDEIISNARENEADSSENGIPSTKKKTSSSTKNKDSGKKSPWKKSRDERRKLSTTTPNSEKRRSISKKSHSIRLTDAVIKGKMLNVSVHFTLR